MNDQVNDPLRTRREFCQQGKFGLKTLQRIEARGGLFSDSRSAAKAIYNAQPPVCED
jgi:hypothetical protein